MPPVNRELPRSIPDVAADLRLDPNDVVPVGIGKAKISLKALQRPATGAGKLVLVSAITPNRAGVGKTTVSVALAMGLHRAGRRAVACLREPSLGPVFGIKGGGTGGGRAQIVPAADINLHFTGDLHAITSAHNLLAALADNALHFGVPRELDPEAITWPRVIDVNDRALRDVTVGERVQHASRFDITAASEVMAILCLADSLDDLRARLGKIVVGRSPSGSRVTAGDLGATDAMTALLLDALQPNLVQTTDGSPALVHGGPFANIAHGCSSVLSTRLGTRSADIAVTEAGFGFDLGGEKFLQIKCRSAGIWPDCVVLAVTVASLERHGGARKGARGPEFVEKGLAHLSKQVENVRAFGLAPVVAINVHGDDPEESLAMVERHCEKLSVRFARLTAFVDGGPGADALARVVGEVVDEASAEHQPRYLYELGDSYEDKVRTVARTLYGANDVVFTDEAKRDLDEIVKAGLGGMPVCIAKTQLSLSDDPKQSGAPTGFDVTVRSARVSAGAGFVVVLMGKIMTMPGLPKEPAALRVRVEPDGTVHGLMQNE